MRKQLYTGSLLTLNLGCIANCGTGYSPIGIILYRRDFSVPVGTTVGQQSDIVYLSTCDVFLVAFQSGNSRPLAIILNALWSISTRFNVLYSNAPVATMMFPIITPVNHLYRYLKTS